MQHIGGRRSDARLPVTLLTTERPPVGTAVDSVFVDDEATFTTGGLAVFVVGNELTVTLGARLAFVTDISRILLPILGL